MIPKVELQSVWLDLTWFIQHHRCIGPHVDTKSICLELMLQPLPRLIPFFEGACSLSLQFILGLPGLLLNPSTSHCSSCFGMRTSSILVTWPSHRNLLSQITFSRSVCHVLFRISSFVTLSLQVIPRMPLSHLWWAAFNFLLNVMVRGHNSAL